MKSIHIQAETLPEAWEKAVIAAWEQGSVFPTEYDKPDDPKSRDCCATIHITNPMKESRIHRAIPMGLDDLEKYRSEVLYGVHDYYMDDKTNPDRWTYTYSARLFGYDVCAPLPSSPYRIDYVNQIERCVEQFKQCWHTRRCIAVTYQTWKDAQNNDPPCLQFIQWRVEETEDGPKLNMCVLFRSNDAYKASFSNMYVLSELQKMVADEVGVGVGSYIHMATSYHIYGSYFDEFKGFLDTVKKRDYQDRVYDSSLVTDFFIDGCDTLLAEDDMPEPKKELVRQRKIYLQSLL